MVSQHWARYDVSHALFQASFQRHLLPAPKEGNMLVLENPTPRKEGTNAWFSPVEEGNTGLTVLKGVFHTFMKLQVNGELPLWFFLFQLIKPQNWWNRHLSRRRESWNPYIHILKPFLCVLSIGGCRLFYGFRFFKLPRGLFGGMIECKFQNKVK